MGLFETVVIDLDTEKQMVTEAIESKIAEGKLTDVEEDFWDEVVEEIGALTEDDIKPEKYVRQAQRKLKKLRRAEARIKERLSPKL